MSAGRPDAEGGDSPLRAAGELSLFLAGDALITDAWSHVQEASFTRLLGEMRAADVTLVNLETVIRESEGYAQADSGGSYTSSPALIARELKWAGVDLLAHANNHAFDYGSDGILSTHAHVAAAGLVLAGSGKDLQAARAPRYFACPGGRVGLVAMASTFVRYGRASRSRADVRGRPGVNPLELELEQGSSFRLFGRSVRIDAKSGRALGRRVVDADAAANLGAIAEAARNADLTIASIHAHVQRGWLPGFARAALAAGADVVLCHGPHRLKGIELVGGKPIFYGLGDFVYQVEGMSRFPAEVYERLGLGDDATAADAVQAGRELSLAGERFAYEGCAAVLAWRGGRLAELRLLPLDLQFDVEPATRGRPRWAEPELGRAIIERIARRSQRYGTQIVFDDARREGRVTLG